MRFDLARKKKAAGSANRAAPVRRKSTMIVLVGVIGGIAGIIGLAIFASDAGPNRLTGNIFTDSVIQQILAPTTPGAYALGGDPDAKITIVEFGDYQCNSCDRFHEATKATLMSDIVDAGRAKFMYKDFNINDRILKPANGSTLASEAAYCAGEQGKFWEYHDELFNKQKLEGIEWVSPQSLREFASNVGVGSMGAFGDCLDSHKYAGMVRENYNLAQKVGLNATPTFVIIAEGKQPVKLVGAHPIDSFEAVISNLE